MKARKTKAGEPNLRDKLGDAFFKAFEADFEVHGVEVIQRLREKSPEKYAELGAKLIAAAEQPSASDFSRCDSVQDIGRVLLKQVGVDEDAITDAMVEQAVEANDAFIEQLERIAQGKRSPCDARWQSSMGCAAKTAGRRCAGPPESNFSRFGIHGEIHEKETVRR
jgi:hypothetical protein